MAENNRKPNNSQHDLFGSLRTLRTNISLQALLAIITVVLTVVLLFSLTVAWYTNIVQTGGLTFETEQWLFEGSISVGSGQYAISPGDEGVVSLEVQNPGEHLVAASVTVEKSAVNATLDIAANLPADTMNKRLYFYVDTPMTRNGERMDRVYVSSDSSYTYTIYPQSSLVLNETVHNAPQLKWEWVYDVLGYYVIGTRDPVNNLVSETGEFIRPIVYDYDETNVTFINGGNQLETINGVSVLDFLNQVSTKDGYPGAITGQTLVSANGYYAIDVDLNGYGVWAYLCNLHEIKTHMATDTALGQSGAAYSAIVKLTGQNSHETALPITGEAELLTALAQSDSVSVRLTENLSLSAPLSLDAGQLLSIDLNEKTLSYLGSEAIISAQAGSQLLLSDGRVQGNGANIGIYSDGAQTTLYDVNMYNVNQGIVIRDYLNEQAADSAVYMKNCQINAIEDGMLIHGNADSTPTRIVIEDSQIHGQTYSGIFCNGSHYGTDIQVLRSTITGLYTAIYHPQPYSIMTLKDSTLEGGTGLVVKGGTVYVDSCTVKGTGSYTAPAYAASGFTDTGDGIYLEANYTWATVINISGTTNVSSTAADTLAVRKFEDTATHASINITGGTFSSNVEQYCAPGYAVVHDAATGNYTVMHSANTAQ
ncbi:MAG: hypothetical protein IJW97_07450 [Clostridia bacterium]|nr:hypothetical protein [Clostridia bacterium]